jgi:hypothetical protein
VLHPSGELELSSLTLRGHISVPRAGTLTAHDHSFQRTDTGTNWSKEIHMNGVVYLVGLVVIVLAILSLLGLR